MTSFRARIATRLSRFAVLVAIAACSSPPASGTTPLTGTVACGSSACGSGQLCYEQYTGAPDGGVNFECNDVAAGCPVFDCDGSACPKCVIDMCNAYPAIVDLMNVMARTVTCPGE